MKRYFLSLIPLLTFIFSGCSTFDMQSKKYELQDFESISMATPSQNTLLEKFGEPNLKTLMNADNEEAWLYFYPSTKSSRMSFIFNKNSKLLVSKTWFVWENEKENSIETAKLRYPTAEFQTRRAKTTNPHYIPDQIIFDDKNSNLKIVFNDTQNSVETISWTVKNLRIPASKTNK